MSENVFIPLQYSHLARIINSLDKLTNEESGFLCRSGNIVIDNKHYFIKELRKERIVFSPKKYIQLYQEYYKKLNLAIKTVDSYGMWYIDNKLIEIQPFIDSKNIMMHGTLLEWETLKKTFNFILNDIDKLHDKYGTGDFSPVGIETAIWNFSKDGYLYDFNPVRLYDENCFFTRSDDSAMIEKTKFRNFTPFGMKVNLLATIGIAVKNKDFILENNPNSWFTDLKAILRDNLQQRSVEKVEILDQKMDFPRWHPMQIINNFLGGGRNE